MSSPRRFAALAVCLLALAAGASACTAGNFQMELISAASGLESSVIAKCLSTIKVSIDTTCAAVIDAPAADNSYIPAMWATEDADTYTQLKLCPSNSGAAVLDTDAPKSILLALNGYAYGFDRTGATPTALLSSGITAVAYAAGKVTITLAAGDLVYAIRVVDGANLATDVNAGVIVSVGAGFNEGSQYFNNDNVGQDCPTGTYGLPVGDIKLCPLCPAGTSGDGNGCTACAAGSASDSVGQSTCATAQCGAGTYAPEGSSDCIPCPMHTYSAAGAAECTQCADEMYAWIPGSATCIRCVNGVPTTAATTAPSSGTHILSFAAKLDTCTAFTSSYAIPALDTCSSWKGATNAPDVQLALEVAGDCSITIKPISDTTCADVGASDGKAMINPLTGTYVYDYNLLLIRAYYTSTTKIRTLLPTTEGGASSFMLNIAKATAADTVTLTFYQATNKPKDSSIAAANTCTTDAKVGGTVATATGATCPAGSFSDNGGCSACPVGYTCSGGAAKTKCAANTANPYLGSSTACLTCTNSYNSATQTSTGYTSLEGADYCIIPYFNRDCPTDGYEWDESAQKCVKCRAGTYRDFTGSGMTECQECNVGKYSGEGAATCDLCPAGQYSPSKGLADQQVGSNGIRCLLCPVGSIALASGESIPTDNSAINAAGDYRNEKALSEGASKCEACPDGTWADSTKTQSTTAALGCTLCDSGYYRIGDASNENNVCKRIPPGYKVATDKFLQTVTDADATTPGDQASVKGAYELTVCGKGTVSNWSGTKRVPIDARECKACSTENTDNSNTYAPRTGMAVCLACKGGYYPNAQNDGCTQCSAGTFRSFYTIRKDCDTCAAGSEVGPSSRQACTLCRPGYYKTDAGTSDFCTACPLNKYQARPGATSDCVFCPRGTETQDTGNSECTPCAVGYYNPAVATASLTGPACKKAPAGTYVNTTGAFLATQCPVGTYNGQEGQDSCEPCPPGQYANTLGNKACKTCPAGTFSKGQATTCAACQAGYYAPAGSGACSPCKPGTYAAAARSGTCLLCPKGAQCPTPATQQPKACPAGTFAAKDGSVLCTPCPVNYVAALTGSKQCTACPAGQNTRGLTGQKACTVVRSTNLRRSVL